MMSILVQNFFFVLVHYNGTITIFVVSKNGHYNVSKSFFHLIM